MTTHIHKPPTRIVATTLANNDAMPRCDRRDFMSKLSALVKGWPAMLAIALYVVRGKIAVWSAPPSSLPRAGNLYGVALLPAMLNLKR